jgi:UDP-glucose 4-epimerase
MAKILVTGGAGFIGSHVADAYLAAGHDVVVLDNLVTGLRKNLPEAATFHELDLCSDGVADLFAQEKPDYVAHLAAQIDVRRSVEDPLFDAQVNILGSVNLLEQCMKYEVKKIIFSSTGGAIYGTPDVLPASEETPPRPECHYATSKLSFEHYIGLYQRLYELPYTILRFPNVYGPRQRPDGEAGVCSILIGLMLQGKTPTLFGFGTPLRDYVYVGDIARGALLALDKGDNAVINLGSGVGTSVQDLFDTIKELLDFQGEPELAPLRPGEVPESYITGDRAKSLLGWEPQVSLSVGLGNTVDYIRADVDA